jgi:hypothetical protein
VKHDFVATTKARSMLMILIATCKETLLALEATGNVLDIDMTPDLGQMIQRSENELSVLTNRLNGARG